MIEKEVGIDTESRRQEEVEKKTSRDVSEPDKRKRGRALRI